MTRSARAALLGAVMLVAACAESPTRPSDIEGQTWRLVSLERAGAAPIIVVDPSRYTLQFADGTRVSLRSDCNTCGGVYSLAGAALAIRPLACTRAFCGDASLDSDYTRALQTAQSFARASGELILQCDGVVLRFRIQE